MASYKIDSAHEGYSDIYDAWVVNGRPAQFDIFYAADIAGFGAGSALFHVLDTTADEPDIYMVASSRVTDFPDNASRNPSHEGMLLWDENYWKMRGGAREDGIQEADWEIKQGAWPPNELVEG